MEIAEGPYPPKLVIDFFESLDDAIDTIKPVGRRLELEEEQVLARYCFVLALFEEVFREGLDGRAKDGPLMLPSPKKNLEELLAIPEDSWIDDLCALSWVFYDKCSHMLSQPVILNPTFDGSGDVGG